MRTHLRVLIAATVAALLLAAPAIAASPIVGTYTAKITSGANPGTWSLTVTSSGAYTVRRDGAVGARGNATFSAGKVRFKDTGGPASCPTAGTYRYTKTASSIRFTKVTDACAGRPAVLTTMAFKK